MIRNMIRHMIRTAALVAAAVVVQLVPTPRAHAQMADIALLSPVPLTNSDWATARVVKKSARLPQEAPAPAPISMATPVVPIAILPPATPPRPTGPALRREATVTSEIVRIGDLIENAGVVADVAIFRAPDLGQSGSVSAARVAEVVRSHHILGLDTRGLDEVRVTRATRTIGAKEIELQLIRALVAQHGLSEAEQWGVSFDGEVRSVHIDPGAELGLARLAYDPRNRRFDAAFEIPNGSTRRTLLRASGTLVETGETVVTLRAIAAGEVLKSTDLRIERRPKTESATIEESIGSAAKRPLKAGQVVRPADVARPEVVARNDNVTISFEVPGMILTVLGKALEAGMEGDVINVLNIQSKRTILATVRGPGRVAVTATSPRLAANAAPANARR